MSNVQEALKAALAAIDLYDYTMTVEESEKFAKAERLCKAALSDIEKCEPVAWIDPADGALYHYKMYDTYKPLHTSPQPRDWVGLTDEDIKGLPQPNYDITTAQYVKIIEAKIRELNFAEKD